jgi:hypothetical protein
VAPLLYWIVSRKTFSPISHPPFSNFFKPLNARGEALRHPPKKEAMSNPRAHGSCTIKKAVGNLGAAHGISPYSGADQWTDSFFHHQHHHATETYVFRMTLSLNLRRLYNKAPSICQAKSFEKQAIPDKIQGPSALHRHLGNRR